MTAGLVATLRARAARDATALRLAALAPPGMALFLQAPGTTWPHFLAVITAALACALVFTEIRGRGPIFEGLVPALLMLLFAPPEAAPWQLALALSLALVLGSLIFGGAGFGFLSIGALSLALFAFSFPPLAPVVPVAAVLWAALPGGVLLLLAGLAPWRVVLAGAVGFALAVGPDGLDPAQVAPFAILLIHLAADPFGAPATGPGQWVSGLMVGGLIALLGASVLPGFDMSAGVFAVLLAGLFAPLIDAGVIAAADWHDGVRRGAEPRGPWARFLARPNEDPVKALGMAGLVALGAALTVSTTATLLEPRQTANLEAARAVRMQAMVNALPGLRAVMEEAGVTELQSHLIDLETGRVLAGRATDLDAEQAARDPETGIDLPPEADIAGLGRRELVAAIHLLERDGEPVLLVLPMRGTGYQSTIHALLALEADLDTIAALTVTEQGETPGLGAQIERADWQALWPGRRIADDSGTIRIEVVRGAATTPYEVDGISGATRTGNGITTMLHFWMGPWGYGPFLDRLAREGLE